VKLSKGTVNDKLVVPNALKSRYMVYASSTLLMAPIQYASLLMFSGKKKKRRTTIKGREKAYCAHTTSVLSRERSFFMYA